MALLKEVEALREGKRAVSGLGCPGMGWDTVLLQRAVQVWVLNGPHWAGGLPEPC